MQGRISSFKIERALSPGSLGALFLGRDPEGRAVVVKMPRIVGDELDHARKERVMSEIDVLRKMKDDYEAGKDRESSAAQTGYEHTLHYLDDGYYHGYPFLVTEFLEGGRIREVYSSKPATLPSALRLLELILQTVSFLHREGIVHRDINPSNLILEPMRDIVLIDFGVAKCKGIQYPEVRAGTRLYSAPEQFERSGKVGEASDLFAVASTIFYVLSSHEPPEITGKTENVRKLLTRINHNLPSHLLQILETAMDPNPENRFSSAMTMLQETRRVKQQAKCYTIKVDEKSYDIFGTIDVGKMHICDRGCEDKGFDHPLSVAIYDPENFISRHHFRIEVKEDEALLLDLESTNGTAVRRKGEFKLLGSRDKPQKDAFKLEPGDAIAIAYNPKSGPYKTVEFLNSKRLS